MNPESPLDKSGKKKPHWMVKSSFPIILGFVGSCISLIITNLTTSKEKSGTSQTSSKSQAGAINNEPPNVIHNPKTNTPPNKQTISSSSSHAFSDAKTYINSQQGKKHISVTILNEKGRLSTELSQSISEIYGASEGLSTSNLLLGDITSTSYLNELEQANPTTIKKLKLSDFTDYLVIGRLSLSQGEKGEIPSIKAQMKLSVIDIKLYVIQSSQSFSAYGNGFDNSQATETAMQNLLSLLNQKHPIIK